MTANEHLNGVQWMPLSRVGQMASGNVPGLTVEQEYQQKEKRGEYTENDHAVASQYGQHPRDYQASITGHVDQHGIINAAQFDRTPGYPTTLLDGYHRYAAQRNLGNVVMPLKDVS